MLHGLPGFLDDLLFHSCNLIFPPCFNCFSVSRTPDCDICYIVREYRYSCYCSEIASVAPIAKLMVFILIIPPFKLCFHRAKGNIVERVPRALKKFSVPSTFNGLWKPFHIVFLISLLSWILSTDIPQKTLKTHISVHFYNFLYLFCILCNKA